MKITNRKKDLSEPQGDPSLRSGRDEVYPVIFGGSVSFQNNSLFISPCKGEKMYILILIFGVWTLFGLWYLELGIYLKFRY